MAKDMFEGLQGRYVIIRTILERGLYTGKLSALGETYIELDKGLNIDLIYPALKRMPKSDRESFVNLPVQDLLEKNGVKIRISLANIVDVSDIEDKKEISVSKVIALS